MLLAVMVCVLASISTLVFASETKKPAEQNAGRIAVATVNGQTLYEDQITPYYEQQLKVYRKYGARKLSPDKENHLRRKALQKAIEQEVFRQESEKMTVPDMDKRVAEKMKEVKGKYPTDREFAEMLKEKKITEKDFRSLLEQRLSLQAYVEKHGLDDPRVPEKDVREYYESNPRAFIREELIKVSHIMIKADAEIGAEGKALARKKTEGIRKEIIAGKDFAELAKKESQDGYAQRGGDLGYIKRGFMPGEFDDAAFGLEVGRVSDVIATKHGFHIIKLHDRKPAGKIPYEEVKDFIGKYLKEKQGKKRLEDHMAGLKKKAVIEILSDDYTEKANRSAE